MAELSDLVARELMTRIDWASLAQRGEDEIMRVLRREILCMIRETEEQHVLRKPSLSRT